MNRPLIIATCALIFIFGSCKDEGNRGQVFIPDVPVNITINTDLPLYFHLQTLGAYTLLEGGNRGIFLIHHFDDNFYALERTCTFESDLSCAVIQVDTTNIQLRCGTYPNEFEACCSSLYSYQGSVIQGPAVYPLKMYAVQKNGSLLTIRN